MVSPHALITLLSMRNPMPLTLLCLMLLAVASVCFAQASAPTPMLARKIIPLNENAIERKAYARISEPNNPLAWGDAIVIETPGKDSRPFSGDNVTYSNLFRFPNGRIYDFYRGFGYDPNYMFSDDDGRTWKYGGR